MSRRARERGYQFGGQVARRPATRRSPAASTRKWADCQFRLYDDNDEDDPEVAHVFSDEDWIVGAISYFLYYSEFPLVGGTRADATAYMDTWTEHFYSVPRRFLTQTCLRVCPSRRPRIATCSSQAWESEHCGTRPTPSGPRDPSLQAPTGSGSSSSFQTGRLPARSRHAERS